MDVAIERGLDLVPVEAKSGQTVTPDVLSGLRYWKTLADVREAEAWLVYGGDEGQQRPETCVLPWRRIPVLGESL